MSNSVQLKVEEASVKTRRLGENRGGQQSSYIPGLEDESDGTRKLMVLVPVIGSTLCTSGILLINELERELRPRLVNFIVAKFRSKTVDPGGAQAVFTTHNTELTNLELLCKDQLYFMDRYDRDDTSELYSVSEFAIRAIENARKEYLIGRYDVTLDIEIGKMEQMPRQSERGKPYVVVFYEGGSGQAYAGFPEKESKDVASIEHPSSAGLFEKTDSRFKEGKFYRDYTEVTDEIWLLFDVETKDVQKWDSRLRIIKQLRSSRKKPGIEVRLLMATGCVKYWFMSHYKIFTPPIQTIAEKECIIAELIEKVPDYQKGDPHFTLKTAHNCPKTVKNSRGTLSSLLQSGLLNLDGVDERSCWLYRDCLAFFNVYETANFLTSLQ